MSTARSTLATSTGWLHLFGDPTRLRLLCVLEGHELGVAQLVRITELSQSRVSTHLGKLREAGLVHDRRRGARALYRVHANMPSDARRLWELLREQLDDATLRSDAARRDQLLSSDAWPESVAGEMERHYSPGRTWQALVHGLVPLLRLGDVLDVGCGDGWTAQLLAERCRSYVGIDRSERLVEVARERAPGATFHCADMRSLPVPDASIDDALLFHALTYVEDPSPVLREIARVLRPGGRVIVSTLAEHRHHDRASAFGHVRAGFVQRDLERFLVDAGLRVDTCQITSRERRLPHYEVLTAVAHLRPRST